VTAPPARCAACHKALDTDDRFCARCGTPTALNDDPAVTLIDPVGMEDRAVTERIEPAGTATAPTPAPAPPAGKFNERLQLVLGAEYDVIALTGQGGFAAATGASIASWRSRWCGRS
jgi:hypothetical protein